MSDSLARIREILDRPGGRLTEEEEDLLEEHIAKCLDDGHEAALAKIVGEAADVPRTAAVSLMVGDLSKSLRNYLVDDKRNAKDITCFGIGITMGVSDPAWAGPLSDGFFKMGSIEQLLKSFGDSFRLRRETAVGLLSSLHSPDYMRLVTALNLRTILRSAAAAMISGEARPYMPFPILPAQNRKAGRRDYGLPESLADGRLCLVQRTMMGFVIHSVRSLPSDYDQIAGLDPDGMLRWAGRFKELLGRELGKTAPVEIVEVSTSPSPWCQAPDRGNAPKPFRRPKRRDGM